QGFHFIVADGRARGIVRAVNQDELGLRVGEPRDLVRVDAEAILAAHVIETGFHAKRFRERRKGSESGEGDDYVRARLGGQPHQGNERLAGAVHDLYGLYRDTLHCYDRLTQTVGPAGAAVDQVVVQEAVARFVVGEGEDVVYGPGRSGARSEVEFCVVFVLVKPGIEQERLQLHASTSKEKLVPVIDSANRRRDSFLFTPAVFRSQDQPMDRLVRHCLTGKRLAGCSWEFTIRPDADTAVDTKACPVGLCATTYKGALPSHQVAELRTLSLARAFVASRSLYITSGSLRYPRRGPTRERGYL